jgi:hypothetical protein
MEKYRHHQLLLLLDPYQVLLELMVRLLLLLLWLPQPPVASHAVVGFLCCSSLLETEFGQGWVQLLVQQLLQR